MSDGTGYYLNQTELDDGVVMYQSQDAQKKNWYVRILLRRGGYVRRSLKTTNVDRARRKAYSIADEVREREHFGLSHSRVTFAAASSAYLRSIEGKRSSHRIDQINTTLTRYLLPYFGHMYMESLTENQKYIDGFPNWRQEYWARYDREVKQGKRSDERYKTADGTTPKWDKVSKRPISNFSYNPSRNAVKMNIIIYNAIIKFSVQQRYINVPVYISYKNLPAADVRSQSIYTFEDSEIKKLRTYFQQDYRKNKVYTVDDDGNRIKDDNGDDVYTLWASRRSDHRHMRVNMRGWFYLLVNTGMRVREANFLKWKDITLRNNEGETAYLAVNVEEYKAKRIATGVRFRTVYAPHHLTRILNEVRRQNAPYNTDDDYVFTHQHKRAPYLNISRYAFRRVLIELDLYTHKSGAKRTAKHLRSYYASKLLQKHPIHLVAAAMGHSIDVCFKIYSQLEIAKKAYELLGDTPQPKEVILLDGEDLVL